MPAPQIPIQPPTSSFAEPTSPAQTSQFPADVIARISTKRAAHGGRMILSARAMRLLIRPPLRDFFGDALACAKAAPARALAATTFRKASFGLEFAHGRMLQDFLRDAAAFYYMPCFPYWRCPYSWPLPYMRCDTPGALICEGLIFLAKIRHADFPRLAR